MHGERESSSLDLVGTKKRGFLREMCDDAIRIPVVYKLRKSLQKKKPSITTKTIHHYKSSLQKPFLNTKTTKTITTTNHHYKNHSSIQKLQKPFTTTNHHYKNHPSIQKLQKPLPLQKKNAQQRIKRTIFMEHHHS